jgi:sugar phosphate isomerase/epimerase
MASFLYGLNTSTIRPASLLDKVRTAAEAGYDAIELWAADVEEYCASGGRLADVAHALDDRQLLRPSMISLKDWCVPNEGLWLRALDDGRRRLELAHGLGVRRIVAGPPREAVPIALAAERYEQLLEVSLEYGVPASLEFLGFVPSIDTLETAWMVCQLAGHPEATLTVDAWHMFRGGSADESLALVPPERISIVHWDDAPPTPDRQEQTDADRVMPGDGILDLAGLADRLRGMRWQGVLSLELFNESYWRQDPLVVARLGLEKMKQSVEPRGLGGPL